MTATLPPRTSAAEPQPRASAAPARAESTGVHRTVLSLVACGIGTISLQALFRDFGWLFLAWLSMTIVMTPAMLLRRRREPQPWHVWPGLVVLVPWLTLVFVPRHAYLHLLPTSGTWHDVTALLSELHRTTANEVAPIHSTTAVRLVMCAMLGLVVALVDLIAVVGRHGALAGVPLLVVFTVAGAVPRHAVPWPLFVISAIGFLMLLMLDADDDLRQWGKRIPRPGGSRIGRAGISAQRIGIVALVAALLLPELVPAQRGNVIAKLFHKGSGSGSGGFGSGGGSIDPFVTLKGDLLRPKPVPLFKVQLTARPGSAVPFYARVNVLSDFTGTRWQRGQRGIEDPIEQTGFQTDPADPPSAAALFRAVITVSGLGGNPPVFLRPTEVTNVGANTRWSESEQLLVGDNVSKGQRIEEAWLQPTPTLPQLQRAPAATPTQLSYLLRLPTDLPAYVSDLVTRLTKGVRGVYAKARAIMDYFTDPANGFSYSLSTKTGDSGSDLVDFLQNKKGFCQQYAAAMGVMLRVAGVPSRIVLGYTHPVPNTNGSFVVTTDDAHAWVEAYFAGVGWVPFDPTPLIGIDGGAASDLPWAPHPHTSNTNDVDKHQISASGSSSAPAPATGPAPSASPAAARPKGSFPAAPMWVLVGLAGAVVIALVPAGLRVLRRRRRVAAAVARGDPDPLWAELADTAVDLGYVWSPARSPRQVASWLHGDALAASGALDQLAAAVETSRYGPPGRDRDVTALRRELASVTKQLRARRSGRVRLLSWLWPASLGWTRRRQWRPRLPRRR